MKKLASILTIILLGVGSMMAQKNYRTISGYVVDKNGNPIPGAEVTTPGGGESVITDSDGSFNMSVHPLLKKLTASYDGMATKTKKINFSNDMMVFTLKPIDKHPWFINVVGGPTLTALGDISGNIGIMAGQLGKWGYYGKFNYGLTENDYGISVGAIKSVYKRKTFFYLGAGYGNFVYKYSYATCGGAVLDGGFIFKPFKHFNFTVGYSCITDFWDAAHNIQIGVGYVF